MSGGIGDVALQLETQSQGLHDLLRAVETVAAANQAIGEAAEGAQDAASLVRGGLARVTEAVKSGMNAAQTDIESLAEGARVLAGLLSEAVAEAHQARASSDAIQSITREIQLLSINAGVEAARSGAAGKGFAVIAAAVKQLAEQTRTATTRGAQRLDALVCAVDALARRSEANAATAERAIEQSRGIARQLDELNDFGRSVVSLIGDIDAISGPSRENAGAVASVSGDLRALVDGVDRSSAAIERASQRAGALVSTSEAILGAIAASGVRTAQSELIATAMEAAGEVAALFEQALARTEISMADLFDETYRPIAGSDPQQHMTHFVALTDRLLPALQERLLGSNRRIVFCAAVDRNGFLPTHNRKYSHAQGRDLAWNNANCRNRRIFADRTGLAAARNRKPFLLQTYRRDMGGGQFAVMEDLSAPIVIRGRHWGGFRFGLST